jgi:hypothetical protein
MGNIRCVTERNTRTPLLLTIPHVGVSSNLRHRVSAPRPRWGTFDVSWTEYPARMEAEFAERKTIRREQPRENVAWR